MSMRALNEIMAMVLAAFPPFNAAPAAAPAPLFQYSGLSEQGFQAYLPQLRAQAERAGVSRRTLDLAFARMEFSTRTVELDRQQPGGTAGNPAT